MDYLVVETLLEMLDSSSSSSSDDEIELEEIERIISISKEDPTRIKLYFENIVPNYTSIEFQSHFRLSREAFENLLSLIGPNLKKKSKSGRDTINVEKQLLAIIWLLATRDSYRSVGERFEMRKSSLSVIFMRVVKTICEFSSVVIRWPTNLELEGVKENFKRCGGIPNIVGVIDGTYVPIKAPKADPEEYINRKCQHSINLQAVSLHNLKFSDVFAGYPGSVSDTRVFINSDIFHKAKENVRGLFPNKEYILGDKAYPVLPWCIPPYINRGNLTVKQKHFNTAHSKSRQLVERSFALLFGRFRRLKYLEMNSIEMIPSTILAACTLHNICLDNLDLLIENYIEEGRECVINENEHAFDNAFIDRNQITGHQLRDELCNLLQNNELN